MPQWRAYMGPQLDNGVFAVTAWDPDGPGPAIPVVVAGGNFQHAGETNLGFVGQWNGSVWNPMGLGVSGTVECAMVFDPDGSGPTLPQPVIGGSFSHSGAATLNCIGRFDGTQWRPFGSGFTNPNGFPPDVRCLALHGNALVAGGGFELADGLRAHEIAHWDGTVWHAYTTDQFAFWSLGVHGGELYAGGAFPLPPSYSGNGIVRWNGQAWQTVGQNYPKDDVQALATYHGQLVVGGLFTNQCCGNPPAPGEFIARFDGAAWLPLGSGLNGPVDTLCVFDPDGPGPMPDVLIAGGSFSTAGGQPASNIAAWDGAQWTPLGSGTSGTVRALTVWNNQLVVAGEFFSAGGLVSPGMAFWGCPLVLPCYPNCDSSTAAPILNISDFSCFLNSFASAGPYANCDGSTRAPTLNILDFICFINKFATGCP